MELGESSVSVFGKSISTPDVGQLQRTQRAAVVGGGGTWKMFLVFLKAVERTREVRDMLVNDGVGDSKNELTGRKSGWLLI